MATPTALIDDLYVGLRQRRRPEDVADQALRLLGGDLSPQQRSILDKAARHSVHRLYHDYWTSMSEDFKRPVSMERQVHVASDLFAGVTPPTDEDCGRPEVVEPFVRQCGQAIRRDFGSGDFKRGRLNRGQRRTVGLGDLSKRQYNKRFRLLTRMEDRLVRLSQEVRKYEATVHGKNGLATELSREDFSSDLNTAAYVAYATARRNLRSVFTNTNQARAHDEIAEMLLGRCRNSPTTNWWTVAHVNTAPEVLARLTDAQKGALLGRWYEILSRVAEGLESAWQGLDVNVATMVVRPGQDSSTWNTLAQAWNTSRSAWIDLLHGLGLESILDEMTPGKAMRFMAADVMVWHRDSGDTVHPDTRVWAALPRPWEVLDGRVTCTRQAVEAACAAAGVDSAKSGWTAPRRRSFIETFAPTPELVHGVAVANPALAKLLRGMRVFSSKEIRAPREADVDRFLDEVTL